MKIKLGCRVGICKHEETLEVDDEDLVGLTEDERQKFLDEELDTWLPNHFDCWASFVEE